MQGKTSGFDNIFLDIFRNNSCVSFLHILFDVCLTTGTVPSNRGKVVIPKSSTADPCYRGIALSCSMYKIYCSILNNRLSSWTESNNILADAQNRFRMNRNTIDHDSTLSNIIDSRKKLQQSTFLCLNRF
jgi:hypothetical protein